MFGVFIVNIISYIFGLKYIILLVVFHLFYVFFVLFLSFLPIGLTRHISDFILFLPLACSISLFKFLMVTLGFQHISVIHHSLPLNNEMPLHVKCYELNLLICFVLGLQFFNLRMF